MCGRVTRTKENKLIEERFKVFFDSMLEDIPVTFNLIPGQKMAAMTFDHPKKLTSFHWGLVCAWDKDTSFAFKRINARSESVREKPSYRDAFKKRRCLLIIDGFYEWKREGKQKQPYYFKMKDHDLFALAGIWEPWQDHYFSCSVITTGANKLMEPIHDRSPVIIPEHKFDVWLDTAYQGKELDTLMQPSDSALMETFPVSSLVNFPKNDSQECIKPVRLDIEQLDLF